MLKHIKVKNSKTKKARREERELVPVSASNSEKDHQAVKLKYSFALERETSDTSLETVLPFSSNCTGKTVLDSPNSIQEAYVIAVEEQAKERLDKLSALHKIKPVDMTKLPHLQNSPHEGPDHVIDTNSVFVAQIPALSNNSDSHSLEESSNNSLKVNVEVEPGKTMDSPPVLIRQSDTKMSSFGKHLPNDVHYNGHTYDNNWDSHSNNSAHRELPVDVPDGFVGKTKVPPKYPTPQRSPQNNVSSRVLTDMSQTDNRGQQATPEQLERIRKYQNEIRKKKEDDDRREKEQEFLRTSLRGSKKLQALMNNPPVSGEVNPAYEDEDSRSSGSSGAIRADMIGTPPPRKPVAMEELLTSLTHIQSKLAHSDHKEDVTFLTQLFKNSEFQRAVSLHNSVMDILAQHEIRVPASAEAADLSLEVRSTIKTIHSPYARELGHLLGKPEMQGLLHAHDQLALCSQDAPVTPEYDEILDTSHYGDENIRIVRIEKTSEPLGATVRNDGNSVIVGRIVKGGAAEKSALIHEGDEILEINGIDMQGKSVNEVCDIMATLTGQLTFLIIPNKDHVEYNRSRDIMVHVKAHFNYDPEDDLYIPCRELGISFMKGDILHVINQEDPNWWQAYREGEEDQALAGLIPSRSFTQQRESMRQTIAGDTDSSRDKKKSKMLCARKHSKKKKSPYNSQFSEDYDVEEILTYEEVTLYFPRQEWKRPVVLIGPQNIGRHELRQRLMESDISRFAAAIPHTSRPKKDSEIDGVHYHFVPRHTFEADILAHKFVEHGEYEKNYYGTSLASIRRVISDGKICVLNLQPQVTSLPAGMTQSLKILKGSDLMPYIIFIAPPGLEKLRQMRLKIGLTTKDEELKKVIEEAREMEEVFGHYFDYVIVNSDLDRAYDELCHEITRIETEPQWIPASWVVNS